MNIFVGNLPFSVTEDDIRGLFEEHGSLDSCKLITNRDTGMSRGFAFVEMDNAGADSAIKALNGTQLQGRAIKVNQAEERKARPARGGYR